MTGGPRRANNFRVRSGAAARPHLLRSQQNANRPAGKGLLWSAGPCERLAHPPVRRRSESSKATPGLLMLRLYSPYPRVPHPHEPGLRGSRLFHGVGSWGERLRRRGDFRAEPPPRRMRKTSRHACLGERRHRLTSRARPAKSPEGCPRFIGSTATLASVPASSSRDPTEWGSEVPSTCTPRSGPGSGQPRSDSLGAHLFHASLSRDTSIRARAMNPPRNGLLSGTQPGVAAAPGVVRSWARRTMHPNLAVGGASRESS